MFDGSIKSSVPLFVLLPTLPYSPSFFSRDQRSFLSSFTPFFPSLLHTAHFLPGRTAHPPNPQQNTYCLSPSIMQLGFSLSLLLTTLLFALAQVEAAPVRRSPSIVTLPLKRLPQQSDVHPTVVSRILDFLFLPERNHGIDFASPSFCNGISTVATAVMRG